MPNASNPPGASAKMLSKYLNAKQPDDVIQVTYVWIDGNQSLRAKSRTVNFVPKSAEELETWQFDGSSTNQSDGSNADVYLRPVRLYKDPFRMGNNKLVLCETITHDQKPTASNTRRSCNAIMEKAKDQQPWFGIEQEYFLFDAVERNKPLGWPTGAFPEAIDPHYFGVGTGRVVARDLINIHYAACLYAGVKIAGINAEACLAQWEFQVGPCEGISAGDDLTMARFLLQRIAEDFHVSVTFDPKPVPDALFGSGCHTNFSTKAMREAGGIAAINAAMPKLEKNHLKHIVNYDPNGGKDNARRLVASPVSVPMDQFVYGVGTRNASIRIPRQCATDGQGYLEDRRPASNMSPYLVSEMLVRTICLDE